MNKADDVRMTVQREPMLFVRLERRDNPMLHWDVAVVPRIDCVQCSGRGVAFLAGVCRACYRDYFATFCITTLPVTRGGDFVVAGELTLCDACRQAYADDVPPDVRVPDGGKLRV